MHDFHARKTFATLRLEGGKRVGGEKLALHLWALAKKTLLSQVRVLGEELIYLAIVGSTKWSLKLVTFISYSKR